MNQPGGVKRGRVCAYIRESLPVRCLFNTYLIPLLNTYLIQYLGSIIKNKKGFEI